MLQLSALRQIWGNLLSPRDWTSYIYVPLLFSLFILLPYLMVKSYLASKRVNHLVESLAHGNPDIDMLSQLMAGPVKPFKGESAVGVRSIEPPNYKGFSFLHDSRILDLRPWNPSDPTSLVYGYRHLKLLKNSDNTGNDVFRMVEITTHPDAQFRFLPSLYQPRLRRMCVENSGTQEASCQFEVIVDLSKVPNDQVVDVIYEHYSRGAFLQGGEHFTTVAFCTEVDAPEVTRWFLLPSGKEYRSYQIVRYKTGNPRTAEVVKGHTDYMVDDPSIIAFKLASVKAGYTFEVTWIYK
jgi:hypothetical protein